MLEKWLNDTLAEAENLEVPGALLKPENLKPISRYHVDKAQLGAAGLSTQEIERVYRSLFVYSVGFYDSLG